MKTYTMHLAGGQMTAIFNETATHVGVELTTDGSLPRQLHGFVKRTLAEIFFHAQDIACAWDIEDADVFARLLDDCLHDEDTVQACGQRVALASITAAAVLAEV